MKAFHQSGTNLISVWKSGPRTVVLSKKKVKCCFICHSNSNFTSLLKLFFFWSYHFSWVFFSYIFCSHLHLPTYQWTVADQLDLMKLTPLTLTIKKGQTYIISFILLFISPFISFRHASSLCNTFLFLFHQVFPLQLSANSPQMKLNIIDSGPFRLGHR